MSDSQKKIISVAITGVMTGALGVYAWRNWELFAGLLEVEFQFILGLVILWLALMTVAALRTKVFVGLFDVDLSTRESVGLEIITSLGGYFLPFKGSQAIKAVYLKKKHGFPYASFVSVLLASYPLNFVVLAGTGAALAVLMYFQRGMFPLRMVAALLTLIAIGKLALRVPLSVPTGENKLAGWVRNTVDGWKLLRDDGASLRRVLLLFATSSIVTGAQVFIAYRALSVGVQLLPALILGVVYTLTFMTSVTPGSSGFAEGVLAAGSHVMQIGFAEGVVTAVLVRGVNTGMALLVGPVLGYVLSRYGEEPAVESCVQ